MSGNLRAAIFVEKSGNAKIGSVRAAVAATYASIKGSCPSSCALRDSGCYAQGGHVALVVRRLDAAAKGEDSRAIARQERRAIRGAFKGGRIPQDGAKGGRDLRLHTSGDCRTPSAARELAIAAENWIERGGGDVWSYTHAWADVPRAAWGEVSVLGSLESTDAASVRAVRAQGYAPAAVVAEHPADGKAWRGECGTLWIPCPAQTRENVTCADCRLCMNADALYKRNAGITFAAHGQSTRKVQSLVTLGRK